MCLLILYLPFLGRYMFMVEDSVSFFPVTFLCLLAEGYLLTEVLLGLSFPEGTPARPSNILLSLLLLLLHLLFLLPLLLLQSYYCCHVQYSESATMQIALMQYKQY